MHRQFAAATESIAADSSYHRLMNAANTQPCIKTAHHHINRRLIGHLFNICPGGKGFIPCSREHDTADSLVSVELIKRLSQLAHQSKIEGIQLFRSVQHGDANVLLTLDKNVLVLCHSSPCK